MHQRKQGCNTGNITELGLKVGPRFREFCSCCCLPLLTQPGGRLLAEPCRKTPGTRVEAKWKHEAICPHLFFPLKLKESIVGPQSLALGSI